MFRDEQGRGKRRVIKGLVDREYLLLVRSAAERNRYFFAYSLPRLLLCGARTVRGSLLVRVVTICELPLLAKVQPPTAPASPALIRSPQLGLTSSDENAGSLFR